MAEEKIRQLVETFGPLKSFDILKKDTDESQLVCVIEYADADSQQQAMEILHTNSPYRVVTAEHAINEGAVSSFLKEKISMLEDDDEYSDIVEDIRLECEECGGRVVDVQVPRICKDPCIDPRHIHDPVEAEAAAAAAAAAAKTENNNTQTQVKRETQDGETATSDSSSSSNSSSSKNGHESSSIKTETTNNNSSNSSSSSSSSGSAADDDDVGVS
ncbi:U2 small nuclear ribonucleoprotein auxiliary factor U2AF, putative [Eimeria praecox]|uniref:U2 small nuclear ribonucleoprotein auxiliary factor U2AF, putative n=1 Tax=Eimeria praecox TaxID=51316 RepID=U6GWG0_9EIME|nr:U2 small nuclear ribonucleoprotein auxiliary factor U2AF, putative [Eimeria praecox]